MDTLSTVVPIAPFRQRMQQDMPMRPGCVLSRTMFVTSGASQPSSDALPILRRPRTCVASSCNPAITRSRHSQERVQLHSFGLPPGGCAKK